jgi:hypothetical protein
MIHVNVCRLRLNAYEEYNETTCVQKIGGQVTWCLLLFPFMYGVASSAVKLFVKQEV